MFSRTLACRCAAPSKNNLKNHRAAGRVAEGFGNQIRFLFLLEICKREILAFQRHLHAVYIALCAQKALALQQAAERGFRSGKQLKRRFPYFRGVGFRVLICRLRNGLFCRVSLTAGFLHDFFRLIDFRFPVY